MNDWEFGQGAQQQIVAQQRMTYGMGAYSWCLVQLPMKFTYTDGVSEVTTSSTGGNLTLLNLWEFDSKQFLLTYHDEDVWPEWTNNIEVNLLQAPWGEQLDSTLYSPVEAYDSTNFDFKLYMACGNENDEGEAATTFNDLMVAAYA